MSDKETKQFYFILTAVAVVMFMCFILVINYVNNLNP